MKIFSWIRRSFNDEKDKSADNVKQNGKQSLMNDDDDEYDDQWKGGLLTIGTFGMDPHHMPNEYYCSNDYNMVEKYEMEEIINNNDEIINEFCDDQSEALIKINKMDGDDDDVIDEHEIMVEKKERITLADLFNAESAEMDEKPPRKFIQIQKEATATPPPGKLPELQLLKKKKQMRSTSIKQISQPVQKLLKRMLKRKIHPELDGRAKSCAAAAGAAGVPSTKWELGAHHTISLYHGINSEVGE